MFKNYRWNIYIINSTAMLRFKRYADKGLNIHLYIVSRETLHTAVRLVWISSTSELKEQHQPHKLLWMSAVSVLESIAMNYQKYHQGSLSLSKHSHAITQCIPRRWSENSRDQEASQSHYQGIRTVYFIFYFNQILFDHSGVHSLPNYWLVCPGKHCRFKIFPGGSSWITNLDWQEFGSPFILFKHWSEVVSIAVKTGQVFYIESEFLWTFERWGETWAGTDICWHWYYKALTCHSNRSPYIDLFSAAVRSSLRVLNAWMVLICDTLVIWH